MLFSSSFLNSITWMYLTPVIRILPHNRPKGSARWLSSSDNMLLCRGPKLVSCTHMDWSRTACNSSLGRSNTSSHCYRNPHVCVHTLKHTKIYLSQNQIQTIAVHVYASQLVPKHQSCGFFIVYPKLPPSLQTLNFIFRKYAHRNHIHMLLKTKNSYKTWG